MVLTTEERVWLVEHVFREGGKYTDVVRQRFAENFQINLFHIVTQFVTLLISLEKHDQWMMPNAMEGQQSYRIRNC